jgi:hypothetical protein
VPPEHPNCRCEIVVTPEFRESLARATAAYIRAGILLQQSIQRLAAQVGEMMRGATEQAVARLRLEQAEPISLASLRELAGDSAAFQPAGPIQWNAEGVLRKPFGEN